MQNPSHGLDRRLQDHVHLISGHRYPLSATLNIDQAYRYLIDAPQIVKQLASMSWTYVQAPQDGTIWLEWLSQDRGDARFPSDGYVWADPEQTYRQDYSGYTIEMMVHHVGFRPNHDPMASHARTRYHFIAKNPSVNAANPDASLWIVHYHQTEPGRMLPSNQIPLNQPVTQIMNARRWLESQGKLERKDFMLHDRMQWPQINVPTGGYMLQPGFYGAQPSVPARQPSNAFPQGPPNKKMKMQHPAGMSDAAHDTQIEDEENTALGDFFDHLTPRDISMARYTQHHRWMEEVFSSPYASNQIVPTDLGLGLMGELKGLTDGILQAPSMDFAERQVDKVTRGKEPQPFTNLSNDQLEEFNKRVTKHLEEGQAEIERMKVEHALKMAEWKKTKTLMQAEKRLRYATWEGHAVAMPMYQLDDPAVDSHAQDGAEKETVEDVVNDVEAHLGVKISSHNEADMIAAGGLEKEEEQPQMQTLQDESMEEDQTMDQRKNQISTTVNDQNPTTNIYGQQPAPSAETGTPAQSVVATTPSAVPQPSIQPEQKDSQPEPQPQSQPQPTAEQDFTQQEDSINDITSMPMDDTSMMEGMDIDINDSNIQFDDSELNTALDDPVMEPADQEPTIPALDDEPTNASSNVAQLAQAAPPITEGNSLDTPQQQQEQPPPPPPSATESANLAADPSALPETILPPPPAGISEGEQQTNIDDGSGDMFNDSTFDDFTNIEDGGEGDGLIDFEGGGLGMDDSAFGEALHGMENADDRGEGNGAAGEGGQ